VEFFVTTDTTKLYPFGDGDHWIEVKQRLTAGEERRIATTMFSGARQRGANEDREVSFDIDLDSAAFVKVAVYLVEWNVPGPNGRPLPLNTMREKFDALRAMDPDAYRMIEKAIDAHVATQEEEKKARNGSSTSRTSST